MKPNFLWFFFLIFNVQCQQTARNQGDWGIPDEEIKNLGFSYQECRIDTQVPTLLSRYDVRNVSSARFTESNDYLDISLSEDRKYVEFTLRRSLIEYRKETWTASMEVQYMLFCDSGDMNLPKVYTYLLIIEDCNTFSPTFNEEAYTINVTLPQPKLSILNQNDQIIITDLDINKDYGTVEVSCIQLENSCPCENFNVTTTDISDSSIAGYKYSVAISVVQNEKLWDLNEGEFFRVGLLATDSNKSSTMMVEFRVEEKLASSETVKSAGSSTLGLAVGIGAGALAILLTIAFSYTTWRNRKTKNILRKLTEAEIREFLEGFSGGSSLPKRSVDCNTPILAMPYNKTFEIQREKLRIDETTVLGSGFFGVVMKGSVLHDNGETTTVAVKQVKRNVGVLYFKALLSELKIMAYIGKHKNIVSLIGSCTHNIRKREVFIAVEFCPNGNLHNYLRAYRANFVNFVQDGKLCGFRRDNYAYARRGSYSNSSKQISTLDLVKWSTQISSGLEYLSNLGVIHGDLACRNVLLDAQGVAKIADFGLSRRLVDVSNYYYTKQTPALPMPWKWMAIESLKDMKFSTKSDIWSYGIVLYEIFSLGQTPFPGLNWDETFVDRLEKGLRLPQPTFSSVDLYEIMKDCWTENPHDRPSIFDIKKQLESMINTLLIQNPSEDGYLRVLGQEKSVFINEADNEGGIPRYIINKYADC